MVCYRESDTHVLFWPDHLKKLLYFNCIRYGIAVNIFLCTELDLLNVVSDSVYFVIITNFCSQTCYGFQSVLGNNH